MKRWIATSFAFALPLVACNDDAVEPARGEVDLEALDTGVAVVLDGSTGTVEVPLSVPLPAGDDEVIAQDLADAVALVVSSRETGATADLAAGTLVSANPSAPGEFAWSIDEGRTTVTLSFYNQTPGGLTLKVGRTYDVQFAVASNGWVEIVPTRMFSVVPTGS